MASNLTPEKPKNKNETWAALNELAAITEGNMNVLNLKLSHITEKVTTLHVNYEEGLNKINKASTQLELGKLKFEIIEEDLKEHIGGTTTSHKRINLILLILSGCCFVSFVAIAGAGHTKELSTAFKWVFDLLPV